MWTGRLLRPLVKETPSTSIPRSPQRPDGIGFMWKTKHTCLRFCAEDAETRPDRRTDGQTEGEFKPLELRPSTSAPLSEVSAAAECLYCICAQHMDEHMATVALLIEASTPFSVEGACVHERREHTSAVVTHSKWTLDEKRTYKYDVMQIAKSLFVCFVQIRHLSKHLTLTSSTEKVKVHTRCGSATIALWYCVLMAAADVGMWFWLCTSTLLTEFQSKTQSGTFEHPDRHTRSLTAWFCLKQQEELGLQHWAGFSIHSGINWKRDNLLHQEQIEKFMWCKLSFIHVQICLCKTLWKQPQDVDMTFFSDSYQSPSLLSFCFFPPPP